MDDSHQMFLEAANFIGAKLCRDAIWCGNRCNWTRPSPIKLPSGKYSVVTRVCGPDLFDGTTGIAIFLARLFASTEEHVFRLTAEAAMHQALSRLDDIPKKVRIGFYKGLTGVAYALTELSKLLEIPKFGPMALLLLEECDNERDMDAPVDVLSGSAGSITALLGMHNRLAHDLPLELAIKQGERLLDQRVGGRGFAYGPDGIAWALSELHQVTGMKQFRQAADHFAHHALVEGDAPGSIDRSQTRWLDGASGVGMALLRRYEISGELALLDRATPAVEKVAEHLSAESSDRSRTDHSLAHGLTGEAELLLETTRLFIEASYADMAERLGHAGIEGFRKDDLPWPCGEVDNEESPGLMTGLAGIGHFYLRLFNPQQTSSLLLLQPT